MATAFVLAVAALVLGAVAWTISQPSALASADQPSQLRVGTGLGAADPDARPQVVEPTAGVAGNPTGGATETPNGGAIDRSATSTTINPLVAVPVTDAVIRQELRASGITANPNQATLTPGLLAVAPIDAPLAVQQVIQAGNEIARLPYVWGGGHGTYADTGYDCSGSISYVFAAAHLLNTTLVSGELAHWGDPGPGKWITIFANAGHTFMYVAGLRFDTVALAETGSRWSQRPADESNLGSFAIRHPPGL
jgi:cell wall-associated NlpC family hydrolase